MSIQTQLQPAPTFVTNLVMEEPSGAGHTQLGSIGTTLSGSFTTQISLVNTGMQGAKGDPGSPGPGATYHDHTQSVAALEWVVNHNLGRLVSTTVLSPGGFEVEAEVAQVSENQARVYFNSPQTGKVLVR